MIATKKKRKNKSTLGALIVSLINEEGPRKLSGMTKILDSSYKSLSSEVYRLRKLGVLEKDADGVLSLVPGIDLAMFGIELITTDPFASAQPQPERPQTLEEEFMNLLISTGVKNGVETITKIYFSGNDIWNAQWLHHVLSDIAEGFVTEGQYKLIMGYWTRTKGIPYGYEDFFDD